MSNTVVMFIFAGLLIFMIGIYFLFGYRNLIRVMLGVEVISKGITLLILSGGIHRMNVDLVQPILVTFIIVETILAAVMIGIVVVAHKIYGSLDIRLQSKLKG